MTLDTSINATLTMRIAYPRALAEAVLMLRPGPLAERNILTGISPKNVNTCWVWEQRTREMPLRNCSVNIRVSLAGGLEWWSPCRWMVLKMQDDEDDDIYAPEESALPHQKAVSNNGPNQNTSTREEGAAPQDEESGEELEEEESDSVNHGRLPARATSSPSTRT